jgi:hypothetical protein
MPRIFLTHPPEALQTYYGSHAVPALEVPPPRLARLRGDGSAEGGR